MIFTIGDTWTMSLLTAQGTVSTFVRKWDDFMVREAEALREFLALNSEDRGRELEAMRDRIRADLPDVTPSDIIDDGLLRSSSDPYRVYVERESSAWIHQAADAILRINKEKYANILRGLLKDRQKEAHLGKYFFELQAFDITLDTFGSQNFDVHLKADLEAKLHLDVDQATVELDADEVGLRDIANDIKGVYLGLFRGELTRDMEGEYNRLSGIFNTGEDAAIRDLGAVLH